MSQQNARCPYCKTIKLLAEQSLAGHFIQCQCCGARGPIKDSEAEAFAAWNGVDESRSNSTGDLQVLGFLSTEAVEALLTDADVAVTCFNKARMIPTGAIAVVRYDHAQR